jgi:hypothetical protein
MTRTLTDEDVEAIIDRAWDRITQNAGRGFISMAWKGALVILLGLASYGVWHK